MTYLSCTLEMGRTQNQYSAAGDINLWGQRWIKKFSQIYGPRWLTVTWNCICFMS